MLFFFFFFLEFTATMKGAIHKSLCSEPQCEDSHKLTAGAFRVVLYGSPRQLGAVGGWGRGRSCSSSCSSPHPEPSQRLCSRCRAPSLRLGLTSGLLSLEQPWAPGQNTCGLVFPRPMGANRTANRFGEEGRLWGITPT